MIKVQHITNEQVDRMVGGQLGTKLWFNGMMNELRRYPNEIPCESGEIPSMLLPFASGEEKVEWGFTAGMSCLLQNEDGSITVQNAEHFPACTVLALLSLLSDAGEGLEREISVTLQIPNGPKMQSFNDLLKETEAALKKTTINKAEIQARTEQKNTIDRTALSFANSMAAVQTLNQLDIGRFVAKVRCVNGSFHVGDDVTVTDGSFHVLQEHCPVIDISGLDNKEVRDSDDLDSDDFAVCFAMWFPPDTPAFDGMMLVKEAMPPAFVPKTMPPAAVIPSGRTTVTDKQKGETKKRSGNGGQICEVLQYEGDDSTVIWEHPSKIFNNRTRLIVREGQEAVFYSYGRTLDSFGTGQYTLEARNIPLLWRMLGRAPDDTAAFLCDVYFVAKTEQASVKWETDRSVRFMDPLYAVPMSVDASGEMTWRVEDSKILIERNLIEQRNKSVEHRFSQQALYSFVHSSCMRAVSGYISKSIMKRELTVFALDENLPVLSEDVYELLIPDFASYGIALERFSITCIAKPEGDENYERAKKAYYRKDVFEPERIERIYVINPDGSTDCIHTDDGTIHRINTEVNDSKLSEITGRACRRCGSVLPEGTRFCNICGARVFNDDSRPKEIEKETSAGLEKNADEQAVSASETTKPEKVQAEIVSPKKKAGFISRLFGKR